ncbi:TPA: hypothetical protein DCZ39_04775 [Patescibacteria group bacterium]|nr:hypothetical protein [Candidatus Gracilibacteria bacterium]
MSNVCGLHLSNALPHQVLMTFLAGHHIFNSMPAKLNSEFRVQSSELMDFFLFFSVFCTLHSTFRKYLFWISAKHLRSISAFPQNI